MMSKTSKNERSSKNQSKNSIEAEKKDSKSFNVISESMELEGN